MRNLEIAHRLASLNLDNALWQRALAVSLNQIGDVRREQGDAAGALEAYDESLQIARRLSALDAGSPRRQIDVVDVL